MTVRVVRQREAASVDRRLLRDGEWFETGRWIDVNSPYDGSRVGRVPIGAEEDIRLAIAAASRVMKEGSLPPHRRSEVLFSTAQNVKRRREELARTIMAEAGKPIGLASLEVDRAHATLTEAAIAARTLAGEVVPISGTAAGVGRTASTIRVPIGVVAAITPFNFPLNLSAHKIAPALAAGCAVVHKPADKTPLSALALARCFEASGLPAGWLNVIVADPARTAEQFLESSEVAMVTFTGSARVGWGIAKSAERTKVSLELGNSTPVLVTESANLRLAARATAQSAFAFAGQACVSAQRVLVDACVHDRFLEHLNDAIDFLVVGDPDDEQTLVGPVINSESRDRILSAIESALADGASLVRGGRAIDGNVIAPTVLANVAGDAEISCREVFGPLLTVTATDSLEDSIAIANSTEFGLQAAIFTSAIGDMQQASTALDFGGVIVNDAPSFRADQMPYGGIKASGNTKEGPAYAIREMTEERIVVVAETSV